MVVAICDGCGKQITDGTRALYTWSPDSSGPFKTVHKGDCDHKAGRQDFSIELDVLPVYLARSLGLGSGAAWKAACEHADVMGGRFT